MAARGENQIMKSNRQLVLICQVFYPEVGTGQTLTELGEELVDRGFALRVVAGQPTVVPGAPSAPRKMHHAGMTIVRTWSTRLSKTSLLGKLVNQVTFFASAAGYILLKERKAQLLILTNPPFLPLLGWLCYLVRRQPFGLILFDIMPEQAELLGFLRPGGWLVRVWKRLNRLYYRSCSFAVVLSEDMVTGALQNALMLGSAEEPAARDKTHVIHIWSDDRVIHLKSKADSAEANRLGLLKCFVVQYSGNHGRFHDIETLLAIARELSGEKDMLFQFHGEGQKKALVDEFIRKHRLTNIQSRPYYPKELLPDALAMSDIGVVAQLPGQERVCYPSKLLGIMAAGRPVLAICSATCAMARMIEEYQVGFVIGNGEVAKGAACLKRAAGDSAAMLNMGRNARALLNKNFSLQMAANQYYELLVKPR